MKDEILSQRELNPRQPTNQLEPLLGYDLRSRYFQKSKKEMQISGTNTIIFHIPPSEPKGNLKEAHTHK